MKGYEGSMKGYEGKMMGEWDKGWKDKWTNAKRNEGMRFAKERMWGANKGCRKKEEMRWRNDGMQWANNEIQRAN
jgi:hypothetical protein